MNIVLLAPRQFAKNYLPQSKISFKPLNYQNVNLKKAVFTKTDSNTLIGPKADFANTGITNTAIISSPSQIKHIQQVLGLKVGDKIKVGVLNDKMGTAILSNSTDLFASNTVLEPTINGLIGKGVEAFEVYSALDSIDNSLHNTLNRKRQIKVIETVQQPILLNNIKLNTDPPPKLNLTVVLALPRPKVLRRLVMDMTAIGVRDLFLVNSFRTDKSYWQSPMLHRLNEFVVEGLQQGVDTVPLAIHLRKRFKPFVEDELRLMAQKQRTIVAHPHADISFKQFSDQYDLPQIICVGAEGGWIDYELDLLQQNSCTRVSFGERILRTEAVVNALCGRYI